MKQPWIGKFVTQHWQDPEVSAHSYHIFRSWKNIPNVVMSVDTSIRQQLLNTKTYRSQKLHEQVEELSCRLKGWGGGGGGTRCVKQRVLTRLWRFRHLNIVGCLLDKRAYNGRGGGWHGHPRTPQLRPCLF